jgi:SAM-dependent methyltransferase
LPTVFDQEHYASLNRAREAVLQPLLARLQGTVGLRSAADIGCGAGYFSEFLHRQGFQVAGVDGRVENVAEAQSRYPEIRFSEANVESASAGRLGPFDLVLCQGLLYHLENPFAAIRNLKRMTGRLLILESMCVPGDDAIMELRDECRGEDQGLAYVAFYPTERCLVKMLYSAGYSNVFRLHPAPEHDDFRNLPQRKQRRTMLAAAMRPISDAGLVPVVAPLSSVDPWKTAWTSPARILRQSGAALRRRLRRK